MTDTLADRSTTAGFASNWAGLESPLAAFVERTSKEHLDVYRTSPSRVEEDSGTEKSITEGGYGHRQLFELVQNAADALQRAASQGSPAAGGRIEVVLTESTLYCANEGEPSQESGVRSILFSHMSDKRGDEIGHFGLGFKSVLAVSKNPKFISRTGSFRFDVESARQRILEIVPDARDTPGLRIAEPVDPLTLAHTDRTLAELMEWAASVVVLPRDGDRAALLPGDIVSFPLEFMLFSGHVGSLTLTDTAAGIRREITTTVDDHGAITLTENDEVSRWRVFKTNHTPAPDARRDGGTIAGRETVPVAWAVPLDARLARGDFWAFFPTNYQCALSGIVNAAWKTNADRQNLLEGKYNDELLSVAAGLVVENLHLLVRKDDPGSVLDLLPARATANWADARLSELIYAGLSDVPCLADSAGTLQVPRELRLIPQGVPEAAIKLWTALGDWPDDWAHSSTGTRERRPRAVRIGAKDDASAEEWLGSIADGDGPAFSIQALLVAGAMGEPDALFSRNHAARKAKIILGRDGELHAASDDNVFLASDYVSSGSEKTIVHPSLQAHEGALGVLRRLGIVALEPLEELKRIGEAIENGSVDWEHFWDLVRDAGPDRPELRGLLKHVYRYGLQLRNEAGEFRPYYELLLPGAIALTGEDRRVALDLVYHRRELDLIVAATGISDRPAAALDVKRERWFAEFETAAKRAYLLALPASSPRPQHSGYVIFIHPMPKETACRLGPLFGGTTPDFRARFTVAALGIAAADRGWQVGHATVRHYPEVPSEPATEWALRRYGYLPTSLGPAPVAECVGAGFTDWLEILPVADPGELFLRLPMQVHELSAEAFEHACERARKVDDVAQLGSFYGAAAAASRPDGGPAFQPPATVRCFSSEGFEDVAPESAMVAPDRATLELLCANGALAVLCPDPEGAEALISRWGLQPPAEVDKLPVEWIETGEGVLLQELYPGLPGSALDAAGIFECVPCSGIWQERRSRSGSHREELEFWHEESHMMLLDSLDDRQRLVLLNRILGLGLSAREVDEALEYQERLNASQLAEEIRRAPTTEAKLALALGPDLLRGLVPAHVLDVVEADGLSLDGQGLARLALSVRDVALLQHAQTGLKSRGLDAPAKWRGSNRALDFVRDLGFPTAFAGQPAEDDPPFFDVDGPTTLRDLHDFQSAVSKRISAFLAGPPRRGLLSLPTGAGKTRVISETLVRAYAQGILKGPALWIADRQELCDQAVQSWKEVWRAFGPQKQRLRISRFWGRTNDSLANLGEQPHLIVATYQTTARRLTSHYEWLRNCSIVVVDEAHGSVAPTYTDILTWLGLTQRQTDRFLVGLTATPFRGRRHDEEETRRLAGRYDHERFDFGVFEDDDPYPPLQHSGVLSEVDHEVLPGTSMHLNASEMESLAQYRVLPSSAEERLGQDQGRNETLLGKIEALDESWPLVVFGTSVGHSQLLAGLLSVRGIPARAIWGGMDPWARRHSIEAFRNGEIRVLVNYGVLTTGFDAPKTRALVVARPVFSPGLYQQMIGRGLRGPLNGGTDRCLIVNVEDNVLEYGEELAFRHFEHLWQR